MNTKQHTETTREIKCPKCGAPPGKACRSKNNKPVPDNHAARHLISISEAVGQGVDRLRMPKWAGSFDHLKIDIIDGAMGPWFHVYSPFNRTINGRDPVDILAFTQRDFWESPEFTPYDGPLPESDEYQSAVGEADLIDQMGS